MRPTFLGFETARKSLMASQKALDITGNNISNIETVGYTRQRLDLFSMVTPSANSRYSGNRISCAGQGVMAAGVSQIRDPFLDKRYRELNADAAEAGIKAAILTDIENVIDNIDTEGLQNSLLKFQAALSSFATDSTDRKELGSIVVQSAKNLVSVLNDYDTRLKQVSDQTKFEIDSSVSDLNATLDKIAVLNKQIVDSYVGSGQISLSVAGDYTVNATYGPNELLDTRNVLLDSLSTYADVEIQSQPDGSVTINMAGATVVEGAKATQLSYREDTTTGALIFAYNSGAEFVPTSGSIKGYLEMYNGNGCYAQGAQTGDEGIPYYRTAIDKFAETIAREFNAMNVDTSDPTTPRPLFVSSDGMNFTAGTIRLSQDWINDPMSIIPTTQDGSLDNAHIFKLLSLFDKNSDFGDKQDFNGTFEGYISYFTNKITGDITFQNGVFDSSTTMTSTLLDTRDSVSKVSMEEEGINLMNYQKWFNASSRLMTTLDEALNTIINGMGLVGRG